MYDARLIGDGAHDTELRIAKGGVRRGEMDGVGEVEELRAELEVEFFNNSRILDKRHVLGAPAMEVRFRTGSGAGSALTFRSGGNADGRFEDAAIIP